MNTVTRQIILHGHMFKNAGTTFDWSLQRNFGEGFVDHREDQRMRREGAEYLEQYLLEHGHIAALSSHHLCHPLPRNAALDLIPVFLFRHPIERIWSVYHFERQQESDTPGAQAAKSKSLRDYVLWRMQDDVNPTIRNFQTRYCTEIAARTRIPETREHLDQAKDFLCTEALFGVVERYDESMVLLEDELADRGLGISLAYVSQNVNEAEASRSREDKLRTLTESLGDVMELVREKNQLDLALYDFVLDELQTRLNGIASFQARLADFQQRCRSF